MLFLHILFLSGTNYGYHILQLHTKIGYAIMFVKNDVTPLEYRLLKSRGGPCLAVDCSASGMGNEFSIHY